MIVGRGGWRVVPLCLEGVPVGRGEEEGGREGDTTGVMLYIGRLGLLSFLLALSWGVFERTGVMAGNPRGRRG